MNEQQFQQDVWKHRPRLVQYAQKLIGSRYFLNAEEIADDALMAFWQKREKFDINAHASGSWLPLLQGITYNRVRAAHGFATQGKRDAYRTREFDFSDHEASDAISPLDGPEDGMLWSDALEFEDERLQAFADLPDDYKRLIWARDVLDMPIERMLEELPDCQGMTKRQLNSTLQQARQMFRRRSGMHYLEARKSPTRSATPTHDELSSSRPCNTCGVTKSLSDFHRDKSRPDGHARNCKPCIRAYQRDRRKVTTS